MGESPKKSKCREYRGKRYKFVKGGLQLDLEDNIADFGWCECEASSNRCKMDYTRSTIQPINGGTLLSFFGCELKENKQGNGTAQLEDAPLLYLDRMTSSVPALTQDVLPARWPANTRSEMRRDCLKDGIESS